ncbi:MAG: hypothetical protein E7540_00925 [Ruminococcaceae bacterium]|nr:hypothetical protein [Oscillospiraceae bacterium]
MKKSKILILSVCLASILIGATLGTFAYLTSQDTVVNTFTVGDVEITLDETKVTADGKPVENAERVKENNYHLVPGMTYTKDPTLTVVKGSEEAYVRMLIKVNCLKELDEIFAPSGAELTSIFNGFDGSKWVYQTEVRNETENTVTYEFRYINKVTALENADIVLEPLFNSITVPAFFDRDDMKAIADLEIVAVGHAIQAGGFENAQTAWNSFDQQMN